MAANVMEITHNDYPLTSGISHQVISTYLAILTAESAHFRTIKNKKAHLFLPVDDFAAGQIIPLAEWYQLK